MDTPTTHLEEKFELIQENLASLNETTHIQGYKLDALSETVRIQGIKLDTLSETVRIQGNKLDALSETVRIHGNKLDALSETVRIHGNKLNELTTAVEVIQSNYVTKEELALLSAKVDVLACNLKAFQAHAFQTFATKEDLANAVYQLTWRMAAFSGVLLSGGFAFARYL